MCSGQRGQWIKHNEVNKLWSHNNVWLKEMLNERTNLHLKLFLTSFLLCFAHQYSKFRTHNVCRHNVTLFLLVLTSTFPIYVKQEWTIIILYILYWTTKHDLACKCQSWLPKLNSLFHQSINSKLTFDLSELELTVIYKRDAVIPFCGFHSNFPTTGLQFSWCPQTEPVKNCTSLNYPCTQHC